MIKLLATSIWDQEFLDSWTLPVGEWAKDVVFWTTTKGETVLDAIAWPFEQLLTKIVDFGIISDSMYDSAPGAIRWLLWPFTFGMREISWVLVVLAFVAIGTISRNFVVGLGAGFGLFICGLLGFQYWDFTVQTIGMIVVAVIICTIIGIPLGIAAARRDQFWNVLRPVLDGMQVIHPFVYLLPVVFFWSTGRTSGTIATMIFALPPLVRLTNLGIRQVPADVVEAARAYGSTERRVLLDVQIPLARPAIMTGLNQTLLMALSMVGIVAIIAGGGLGQPILRGVNTLNITLSVSAGLSLYLVGVVLDRISQPIAGEDRPSLARRIGAIWFRRAEFPGTLDAMAADEATGDDMAVATAGVADAEDGLATPPALAGALTSLSGAILIYSGLFLTWGENAGLLSAWGRDGDRALAGEEFSGVDASGGSWFGIVAVIAGVLAVLVGIGFLSRRRWPRLLGPEAGLALGVTGLAVPISYLIASPAPLVATDSDGVTIYSDGLGATVALIGGVGLLVGAVLGAAGTRFVETHEEPRNPLKLLVGVAVGVVILVGSVFASWVYDERTPGLADLRPQIEAMVAEGVDPAVAAAQVAELAAASEGARVADGLTGDGPRLGVAVLILAGLAAVAVVYRFVVASRLSDRAKWMIDSSLVGVGTAAVAVGLAWVLSIVRIAESQLVPGVGSFFTMVGGLLLLSAALPYVKSKILAGPAAD